MPRNPTRTFDPLRGRRRRGSTYLVVCGMCLLVATIALGALSSVRVRARSSKAKSDAQEARLYAVAATEMGRVWIAQDANWRTDYANGVWFANKAIGRGSYSLSAQNPNGPLNNSPIDPLVLTGSGVVGRASQSTQVTLMAKIAPYTCLNAALVAAGGLNFGDSLIQANNQTLASNLGASALGAVVNGNIETTLAPFGFTYNGSQTLLATPRTMPDATVFSYYQAKGTSIPRQNIQNVLLSPTSNPYGSPNPMGIYVIDCLGGNMNITQCRIVGTLVLLNPGNVQIQNQVVWSPAVANYPCLLINGNLTVNSSGGYLTEGGSLNLNPPGVPYPYPSGASNSTTTDSYAPAVSGLIYTAGNLTVQGSEFTANLLVVGGSFATSAGASLYLNYDATYFNNPPPGFGVVSMVVAPGTWRQVTH